MKIEKISENQIRCTLTSADLSSRQMKLSELAYGSEKARRLFQDMMQEAEYEFGFTSDNSPLMIEAIPTSLDSIVLIITKVEDPEELDTRFARFTKSDESDTPAEPPSFIGADDILDLDDVVSDVYPELGADNRIYVQGNHDRKVSPDQPCTRAQIVTFLYRVVDV